VWLFCSKIVTIREILIFDTSKIYFGRIRTRNIPFNYLPFHAFGISFSHLPSAAILNKPFIRCGRCCLSQYSYPQEFLNPPLSALREERRYRIRIFTLQANAFTAKEPVCIILHTHRWRVLEAAAAAAAEAAAAAASSWDVLSDDHRLWHMNASIMFAWCTSDFSCVTCSSL